MIGSVVREVVAPLLRECPRECDMVSLTEVEVSSDLSYATCFISALKVPDQAIVFLKSRLKDIHAHLAKALQIHRIPKVRFRIDPRTERGSRIEQLLQDS